MLLFIPRSLCALKRVAAKSEDARFGATTGIRIALAAGLYRAEATDGHRAMVVQGLVPIEDPPWPGFKDLPDDACEAIVLPKDLERASCERGHLIERSKEGTQRLRVVSTRTRQNHQERRLHWRLQFPDPLLRQFQGRLRETTSVNQALPWTRHATHK